MTPLSGSWNGTHNGEDPVVVAGWEVLGIRVDAATALVFVVVVDPGVGSDPVAPIIPVDSRTATV